MLDSRTRMYRRHFEVQCEINCRLKELLPTFEVTHQIMSKQRKAALLDCAYRLRDGYPCGMDTLRDYLSSLSVYPDFYSVEAYLKYRINRTSKKLVRYLSDQSPRKKDYESAIEEVKKMLKKEKLSYSERPAQGLFRKVFLFDDFVVKYEYMLGQQENEVGLWFNKPNKILCPIDYVSEDSHFIVMPRCEKVDEVDEIAQLYNFDPESEEGLILNDGSRIWELAEESNWGILDGEYVIVDYGASTF